MPRTAPAPTQIPSASRDPLPRCDLRFRALAAPHTGRSRLGSRKGTCSLDPLVLDLLRLVPPEGVIARVCFQCLSPLQSNRISPSGAADTPYSSNQASGFPIRPHL